MTDIENADIAQLGDYQVAKDAHDKAKESVKPASLAAKEARAAFVAALKQVDTPVAVDGRLYRIAGNGQFVEDEVRVLGDG